METRAKPKEVLIFILKCTIIHALTYWVFGIVFSNIFSYKALFEAEVVRDYMRSYDDGHLLIGALSQILRGALFGLVFWPLRNFFTEKKLGWLYMWGILVIVGIINTPAASPSSIEGVLYSKLPIWYHGIGLPEVTLQTLAFSLILVAWERKRLAALSGNAKPARPASAVALAATFSLMIGAFGYMGYAVSAIAGALLSGVTIDFKAASADMSQQIVFFVAFAFNFGLSFLVGLLKEKIRIHLVLLLCGFVAIDVIVPFVYSAIFYGAPFEIWFALLLGSVPGIIVGLCNYFMFYRTVKAG